MAERGQESLRERGEKAFDALFGSRAGGRLFDAATDQGYRDLHLQIFSEDPRVLSWPWEAMRDPEAAYLSHTCQIERRLDKVRDPLPLSSDLPEDRVNILLITARPYENERTTVRHDRPAGSGCVRLRGLVPDTIRGSGRCGRAYSLYVTSGYFWE
ncbi:MAG: hypothetical protein GY859_25425 [Desulfobacterales bacterium]|nr:hypothetical protein [Desulfobacterales bacterium]